MNLTNTNQDVLIEQCIDLLHENDLSCILTSISSTGYPKASVIKPICGLGIDTIYFRIGTDSALVEDFECNRKGSITYYRGENSAHIAGDIFVISSEELCQDVTDKHLLSASVPDGCVLLRFNAKEAHIQIGETNHIMQL